MHGNSRPSATQASREGEEDWVCRRHPALAVAWQGPLCGELSSSEPSSALPQGLCMSVALGPTLASGQAASGLLLEQLAWGVTVDPSFLSWGPFHATAHRPLSQALREQ